ncbi:hypothetical protein ACLESO_44820 [Pyxidicoccus sp. 3LG]
MANAVRVLWLSLGVMLWACGGGSPESDAGTAPDAGTDGGDTVDGGNSVPDAGTPWDAVGAAMESRVAEAGSSVLWVVPARVRTRIWNRE